MRKIDIDDVAPDEVAAARAQAGPGTVTVTGYVVSADGTHIAVARGRDDDDHVAYPRDAVRAAFDGDDGRVTLVVDRDARARVTRVVPAASAQDPTPCGGAEPDVAYAMPLSAIHPLLAELERLRHGLLGGGSPGATDLACADARAECYRNGGTAAACEAAHIECLFQGFVGAADRMRR